MTDKLTTNCSELKPVPCGCGGEAEVTFESSSLYYTVHCKKCEIETYLYDSEAEAITAWNLAMGSTEKSSTSERTAKVVTEGKPIEGSDNYIAVTCCDKCGNVVSLFDTHCSGCGARLEWGKDE